MTAAKIQVTQRFEGGFSWGTSSHGLLECRAHALVDSDGGIWLIDPLDGSGLDEELEAIGGEVRGVVVLLDRHLRDAARLARRYGARLFVPPGAWRRGPSRPPHAELLDEAGFEDCPFVFTPVVERPRQWLEWCLWWPERRILVVAEAVGTASYYLSRAREPLAVHPILRIVAPPRALARMQVQPERLLVGHGHSILHDVPAGIEIAVEESRRELPHYLLAAPRHAVKFARTAIGVARGSC